MLFYRFTMAVVILGVMLLVQRKSFSINSKELKVLLLLGVLFSASCITYYESFQVIDAGIASTILFVYPIIVALLMSLFFKERLKVSTMLAILFALGGISLLYKPAGGAPLNTMGVVLVVLSALCYAVYIVIVNQSSIRMSSLKLTFYVLLVCMLSMLPYSLTSPELHLQLPPSLRAWFFACWLGLVPTVLSLVLMTVAVHEVGATPTAIMGALEPLTAVAIGVIVFGEQLTFMLGVGIVLILSAVLIVVLGKNFHMRTIRHTLSAIVRKTWRWKS